MKLNDDLWKYTSGVDTDGNFRIESEIDQKSLAYIANKISNVENQVLEDAINKYRIATANGFYEFLNKFKHYDKEEQNVAINTFNDLLHRMCEIQRNGED